MNVLYITIAGLAAYLLGSIPSAVWAGKLFHGIDVREHGSGNAGATNVIRVLGWKTGVPVLLFDMAKGFLAAMLPKLYELAPEGSAAIVNLQIFTGFMAIIGHIFPVFAGFRGGKGVAAMFGILLAIHPPVTLLCLGVFLLLFLTTGIVSIGSIIAGIAFPVFLLTLFETPSLFFKIFSVMVAVALLVTHRKNIQRIIKGEEKRLFGKKQE
ncbi:MAG TPA: acyl-phosphate glycerol 3-phosphate acyltransferase [Bacteroidales bacterium]|nr:acyl-phosphate glycerol 3-phosphate acyltransferase [Bacteroidales bacterium]